VESDPVARNFLVLLAIVAAGGWFLWFAVFRHDSVERRVAGFAFVFVAFVVGVKLIDSVVF
jgi:hypothetical protein